MRTGKGINVYDPHTKVPTTGVDIVYNRERRINDGLFKSDSEVQMKRLKRNRNAFINRQQKTLHIFHNIKGDELYVTYDNEVKVPIEFNREITGNKGVYIVERQHVPRVTNTDISGLKEYYASDIEIEDEIIEDILKLLTRGADEEISDFIRHISFIPESVLISDESTFVPEHNILISINEATAKFPDTTHFNLNLEEGQININIFDSRNPGKIYYSNAFGVIRKIKAKSALIEDGVYIYFRQNNRIREIKTDLKGMTAVGVYNTPEEAMAHGDISSYMELMKMRHQMHVMNHEEATLLIKLKTQIESSNLTLEEKRLSKLLIDERLKLEKIKQEGAIAKSEADKKAASLKELGILGDIVTTVGKVATKFI